MDGDSWHRTDAAQNQKRARLDDQCVPARLIKRTTRWHRTVPVQLSDVNQRRTRATRERRNLTERNTTHLPQRRVVANSARVVIAPGGSTAAESQVSIAAGAPTSVKSLLHPVCARQIILLHLPRPPGSAKRTDSPPCAREKTSHDRTLTCTVIATQEGSTHSRNETALHLTWPV